MNADWTELEDQLRSRSETEPDDELRARVMRAVSVELSYVPNCRDAKRWAAIAAAAVLLLNFSMVSTSHEVFSFHQLQYSGQISAELQAIYQIETQQEGIFK